MSDEEEELTNIVVDKGHEHHFKSRDPQHLHDDLTLRFHAIFGEPDETIFSYDFMWRFSSKVYTCSKLWCYRFLTLMCGLPIAIYWGCQFAVLSFCAIWCWEPYITGWVIRCNCIRRLHTACINAVVRPFFEACGYIFYNIRVRNVLVGKSV